MTPGKKNLWRKPGYRRQWIR